jgi:hypothetical protein
MGGEFILVIGGLFLEFTPKITETGIPDKNDYETAQDVYSLTSF